MNVCYIYWGILLFVCFIGRKCTAIIYNWVVSKALRYIKNIKNLTDVV